MKRPKVAVVYKTLPQYRRRFFELLKERLDELGVEFVLIYGQAGSKDASKKDTVDINWANKISNKIIRIGNRELYWQPCLHHIKGVDLVIAEQASKLLVNYVLQVYNLLGLTKFAFWGHGKNFQAHDASRLGEFLKRFVSNKVFWWFTYNNISTQVVKDMGFPEERITSVQNAIDTRALIEARSKVDAGQLTALKKVLGIQGENVCIFASSMYREKRLEFLVEACLHIKEQVRDFEFIFIGAGPDEFIVKNAAAKYGWVHYVGPQFDEKKVPYFMLSKLLLMPGLVGLGILDAFALQVPLVTTRIPYHSPEIEYLQNGVNGVIVENVDSPAEYASAIVPLLQDEGRRSELVVGCMDAAGQYTVEEMVVRFAQGVMNALEMAK